MATEPKPKAPARRKKDRQLANLELIEKKLVNKIDNRIPKFTEPTPGSRDAALERAERHLEGVRLAIKNHPKNQ